MSWRTIAFSDVTFSLSEESCTWLYDWRKDGSFNLMKLQVYRGFWRFGISAILWIWRIQRILNIFESAGFANHRKNNSKGPRAYFFGSLLFYLISLLATGESSCNSSSFHIADDFRYPEHSRALLRAFRAQLVNNDLGMYSPLIHVERKMQRKSYPTAARSPDYENFLEWSSRICSETYLECKVRRDVSKQFSKLFGIINYAENYESITILVSKWANASRSRFIGFRWIAAKVRNLQMK